MIESLEKMQTVLIDKIKSSPFNSRQDFNHEILMELAKSIKREGLLNPIIIRQSGNLFEVICGERRLRACEMIGHSTINAFVRELSDDKVLLIQLAENLQREDLNLIEEAKGLQRVIDKTSCTTHILAAYVNKSQTWVVNRLSFLNLRDDFKEYLVSGKLGPNHIKPLKQLEGNDKLLDAVKEVIDTGDFSVRSLWQVVHGHIEEEEKKGIPVRKTAKRVYKKEPGNNDFHGIVKKIRNRTNNREIYKFLDRLCKLYEAK